MIIGDRRVPIIRALPDGSNRLERIDRGDDVGAAAAVFIASGGRYRLAVHDRGHVEVVAAYPGKGPHEIVQVAREVAPNGPGLPEAVDRVVWASIKP